MIKSGVNITGLRPEIVLAASIIQNIFRSYGAEFVITSALDGDHMNGSLHYSGAAIDIRTRHLSKFTQDKIFSQISEALGPQFDAIHESNHFHIEFQPKG